MPITHSPKSNLFKLWLKENTRTNFQLIVFPTPFHELSTHKSECCEAQSNDVMVRLYSGDPLPREYGESSIDDTLHLALRIKEDLPKLLSGNSPEIVRS